MNINKIIGEARRVLTEFIFGAVSFEFYRELKLMSLRHKNAIYLIVIGEILGVPFLSNYYSLRLLPYIIGDLPRFKREAARERDILEEIGEIHVH